MSVGDLSELDQTLSTEQRADLLAELLAADRRLQHWALFLRVPVERWPADVVDVFSRTPLAEETSADMLQRWWNLFRDEIELVHDVRNRLVHQVPVSDATLRRVHLLAVRLQNTTVAR